MDIATTSTQSLMENYEQQYAVLSADITSKIGQLYTFSGQDRIRSIAEIEKEIEDLQELMEQMDLEVRGLSLPFRSKFTNRIFSYKAEVSRLCQEFSKIRYNSKAQLSEGFGQFAEFADINSEQKQRLLDTTEQIELTGKHLSNGCRIAIETEQIGSQMLNDLHSQRDTIKGSIHRLQATNSEINQSSRILSRMVNRSLQHKMILIALAVLFFLIISFTLYYKVTT